MLKMGQVGHFVAQIQSFLTCHEINSLDFSEVASDESR